MQAAHKGSTFLRNNSFSPYLKKQQKSRDKGYIYRQTFAAILQLYFLFFYIFMYTSFFGFPICVRIQSAPIAKNLRKANLQKTRVNITIVHTFTKKLLSASPAISKKQTTSVNNTSMTPAISREPHLQITSE